MIIETIGHPLVYGEKIMDKDLPTILFYGHYDVQPADPYELWDSPPFSPIIKEGKIFARGASDDKGQVYFHIKALETMLVNDQLPCNIKFIIEGEEEIGSGSLSQFLEEEKNQRLLQADVLLVSDTSFISMKQPSLQIGLRGIIYMEVTITGPNHDLHSGAYGGGVGNPIHALVSMLDALKDKENRITIPGFYDDVVELSATEKNKSNEIYFDVDEYKAHLGIKELSGEVGYNTIERISIRPTLEVNGIWGGHTTEGPKTVLPAKAQAKISTRLVPNQDPKKIEKALQDYLKQLAPPYVKVEMNLYDSCKPVIISSDSPAFQATIKAIEEVFGKKPVLTRGGGSIPIISKFQEKMKIDVAMLGLGLPTDLIHSPNEHFGIDNFLLGIETVIAFYQHYADLQHS